MGGNSKVSDQTQSPYFARCSTSSLCIAITWARAFIGFFPPFIRIWIVFRGVSVLWSFSQPVFFFSVLLE